MFEEIMPSAAYEALQNNAEAQLIDCRSMTEWNLIGTPDLSPIGKQVACLEWQSVDGQRNESFCDKISEHIDKETAIYIICRSGARSAAACAASSAPKSPSAALGHGGPNMFEAALARVPSHW